MTRNQSQSKYIYRVQGLEQDFATKKEAFRQARNLGAVIRECCERLGEKFDGIQVTQHERNERRTQ